MGNKPLNERRNKKRTLEQVKALLESKTVTEAYMKTHPRSSRASAEKNQWTMWNNPDLVTEFKKALDMERPMTVNKENLEKLLMMVVVGWTHGKERTTDFVKVIELLSKLVPDFVDRKQVSEYERMSSEDLEKEIKRLTNDITGSEPPSSQTQTPTSEVP